MSADDPISVVCAGIQAVGSLAEGVVASYSQAPDTLETSLLPALYPLTGQARHDAEIQGEGFVQVTRTYNVQVAVQATGQGTPSEVEQDCRALISSVCMVFRRYPMLKDAPGVLRSMIVSDSGPALLTEWGGKYIGFEIRLEVTTIEPLEIEE